MKRTNPTAQQFKNGMNATGTNQMTGQTDMASILEQCATTMMEGQR